MWGSDDFRGSNRGYVVRIIQRSFAGGGRPPVRRFRRPRAGWSPGWAWRWWSGHGSRNRNWCCRELPNTPLSRAVSRMLDTAVLPKGLLICQRAPLFSTAGARFRTVPRAGQGSDNRRGGGQGGRGDGGDASRAERGHGRLSRRPGRRNCRWCTGATAPVCR